MRITASKTSLALACGYSFREDVPELSDPPGPSALRGTEFHSGIEAVLLKEREPKTAAETNAALWLSLLMQDFLGELLVEAAIAWKHDTDDAVYLGRGRAAYADSPKGWLTGTADVLIVGAEAVLVLDWKTGEVGAHKAAPQLRTLAVASASAFGRSQARVLSVYVDPDGGEVRAVLDFELDALDLAVHRTELREAIDRVPSAEPVLGEHCNDCYCGQRGACPARGALVEAATPDLVPVGKRNPLTAPIASDADAAALLEALPHVEDFIKRRKDEVRDYVKKHHGDEMRISPTHVFRRVESKRTYVDGKAAIALAKRLGATDADEAECTRVTPVESYRKQRKDTAA